MPISKGALGINARNYLYIRKNNPPKAKRRADHKLATKRLLIKHGIQTSSILKSFTDRKSLFDFDWNLPKEGFVIKPSRGYGGEGIEVFKYWNGQAGYTISEKYMNIKQLESHILDIFDGVYSLQSLPDSAFIEEKINPDPFFKKIVPLGLPDIRLIVFHKVPIMAMLRLPTERSHGTANLHSGAVGVGVDLRTGITKDGVYLGKVTNTLPGTKMKVRGIKIPNWDDILMLAAKSQDVSGLGFAGVDIVVDGKKGPLILEINSRPGLGIQIANMSSLRSRLERIENLKINNLERGIEVAKSLFAEEFSDKVQAERKILSLIEPIRIFNNGISKEIEAKIDSGAYRSSLDRSLVQELGFPISTREIFVKAASGQQIRRAVKINFELAGKQISTVATVALRAHLQYPMIIGRRDLKGFLINPVPQKDKEDKIEEDIEEVEE